VTRSFSRVRLTAASLCVWVTGPVPGVRAGGSPGSKMSLGFVRRRMGVDCVAVEGLVLRDVHRHQGPQAAWAPRPRGELPSSL
jgi:hypothetical protein